MKKKNLCDTCSKMAECFQKGIFEKQECENYVPLSNDELDERDAFLNAIFIGPCPKCHSEATVDCDNHSFIEDVTVGYCRNCGSYFCSECGYLFKPREKKSCHHWKICEQCPDQPTEKHPDKCNYLSNVYECPKIAKWLNEKK